MRVSSVDRNAARPFTQCGWANNRKMEIVGVANSNLRGAARQLPTVVLRIQLGAHQENDQVQGLKTRERDGGRTPKLNFFFKLRVSWRDQQPTTISIPFLGKNSTARRGYAVEDAKETFCSSRCKGNRHIARAIAIVSMRYSRRDSFREFAGGGTET